MDIKASILDLLGQTLEVSSTDILHDISAFKKIFIEQYEFAVETYF